jgi:Uma2 family endonuclease
MAMPATEQPASGAFTFDDLDNAPDDGRRRELIGGSLVVSPAPFGLHQWVVGELRDALRHAGERSTVTVAAPYDWRYSETVESFQPDVVVVRRADFDPHGPLRATPLLCVEVLSAKHAEVDRSLKRDRYEALGVPSYWIVDPAEPSITELRLREGRYDEAQMASGDEEFDTDWPFPVHLVPADLVRID